MPDTRVVGVLLAAGSGSRFGGDKLLAALPNGMPVGLATLRALANVVNRVVGVVRPGDAALQRSLLTAGAHVEVCARAAEGMGASLACGVTRARSLWPDAIGWLVVLADMPWLTPSCITPVVDALVHGASIAAPVYRGVRGHPVGFAARHYDALAGLGGDQGARALLASRKADIMLIETDDASVVRDVDTRADLAQQ
jgi:molybdenum cofactor cytidylyltransferase